MSKEIRPLTDMVIEGIEVSDAVNVLNRSESGRRRAVETFQGEKGDLVSISLKEGYKLGKDSTGKKLMIVQDSDDTQPRRLSGLVTWLSCHYVVVGLVTAVQGDLVDLEVEVPIEAIDNYRALTADMSKPYKI